MDHSTLLELLKSRSHENWLIGIEDQTLIELATQRWQELIELRSIKPQCTILLAESDPVAFMAGWIAATTTSTPLFLGNPTWSAKEWQQVFEQVTPDLIWGNAPPPDCQAPLLSIDAADWILIPTGGSSGKIRFAIHTLKTLSASIQGFQNYFEIDSINSCCILPLYHVSGLMQVLRSFLSGGKLAIFPYHQIDNYWNSFDPADFFLSLVPTQLQRLMDSPVGLNWLKHFHMIFLGGAPAWPQLLETARSHQLPLAPTYGMTETAAQIATLKPQDFLLEKTGCGQVLPHAKIKVHFNDADLSAKSSQPTSLNSYRVGTIAIQAKSLMLGYFPHPINDPEFLTDDLGYIDSDNYLHIVGRSSQKIITGGENVFPAEVEAAVRTTGLVLDVCVIGMPDQTWGEAVTAVCVPDSPEVTVAALKAAIAPRLSKFKHPKHWILVSQIPRNSQGKINYAQLKQFLELDRTQTPLLPQIAPLADAALETQLNSR